MRMGIFRQAFIAAALISRAFVARADVPLSAGARAALVLDANDARIQAICKNVGIHDLRLGDSLTDATHGTPLKPGEALTLDVTSALYAYSAAGSAINCGELVAPSTGSVK
jgi:hypothetical protein